MTDPQPPVGADIPFAQPHPLQAEVVRGLPPQQCGRCRLLFEGDPTLHHPARPEWWLCPPCRAILLGRTPGPNDVAPRRYVGEAPSTPANHRTRPPTKEQNRTWEQQASS